MSIDVLAPLNYTKEAVEPADNIVPYDEVFQSWFSITDNQRKLLNEFCSLFYLTVRIIDDIQDNTLLESNGKKTAHAIFGVPLALNAAMISNVQLLKLLLKFKNERVIEIFNEEYESMWIGQGEQLQWTYDKKCPSIDEVVQMESKKGVLVSLFGRMLCALSGKDDTPYINLFKKFNLLLQVENDIDGTSTLRDITEGQYNFVSSYAIQQERILFKSNKLEEILLKNTQDRELLNEANQILISTGAFEFSEKYKSMIVSEILAEVKKIGGNQFCESMMAMYAHEPKQLGNWRHGWRKDT